MSTSIVAMQLMVFVILIVMGFLLYKKNILDIYTARHVSILITNVCNPLLIISCCLSDTNSASHSQVLVTFAVSAGIYAFLILAGYIVPLLLKVSPEDRNAYNMMCVYGNTGFIGIPLTQALVGDSGVIYVTIFNLIYTVLIYTHGKAVLGNKDGKKFSVRNLLTPGFIFGIIAILIYWFDIRPPQFITKVITYSGNATTFLSMTVLGVSLTTVNVKELLKNVRLHIFIVLRFIIIPILIILVLKQLHLDRTMISVLALMVSVPVGNMPLMLSHEAGMPVKSLSEGIAWSTILSVITITVVTRFI